MADQNTNDVDNDVELRCQAATSRDNNYLPVYVGQTRRRHDDVTMTSSTSDDDGNWSNDSKTDVEIEHQHQTTGGGKLSVSVTLVQQCVFRFLLNMPMSINWAGRFVLFDPLLLFDHHINNAVSKANYMLGLMQRNFRELSRDCFVTLYNYKVLGKTPFRVCQHCVGTAKDM